MTPDKVTKLIERLISEAKRLLSTSYGGGYNSLRCISDTDGLKRWSNELILLHSVAGSIIKPWKTRLGHNGIHIASKEVESVLATLETIKYAIDEGLLVRFEDLVIAETLTDLFTQGEYLLSNGYFIAAGVLFRAVLEERLRILCDRNGCTPTKKNPTIGDFNIALYSFDPPVYDKSMMHNITAIAAVGNDAAHNNPALKIEDVIRMKENTKDFMIRYST
jgi:hypothetical protein